MPTTVVHFQIRIAPELHEKLASWAREDNHSLNALVVEILERAQELHVTTIDGSAPGQHVVLTP